MRHYRRRSSHLATLTLGVLLGVAVCSTCRSGDPTEPATLVLWGGRIVTVDPARPEVEALAIRGTRIAALGSRQEINALVGPATEVIDLDGALAIPGLIDSHAHFLGVGMAKMQLELNRAASWDEIVAMVAEAVQQAAPGQWILGRGWHQDKWRKQPQPNVAGLPYHDALSKISPDNPVKLRHASGHASIVNARAMELAGITATTPDPPGGEIVRDGNGTAIGVLREAAEELLTLGRDWNEANERQQARLAAEECLSKGITTVHDAGSSFREAELLKVLAEEGRLGVRLWVMLGEPNEVLAARLPGYRVVGAGGGFLTVGGIKRLIDGALGSHGAWLLEPYDDLPESVGLNTYPIGDLRATARLAAEHDLQLCVHAIGDRANRETLDVFEQVLAEDPEATNRRWRIEHAQHLHPTDVPRFAGLGVIAAMQPIHCTSDAPWVPRRLGERRSRLGAYIWRSLLEAGTVICSGTDAPVEDIDPIANFHAAVTRRSADGSRFYPEQRMTRLEALRSYTIAGAYAAFEEELKGSLELGKLADITVLSQDILEVPEEQLLETTVLSTIIGGKVAYHSTDRRISGGRYQNGG